MEGVLGLLPVLDKGAGCRGRAPVALKGTICEKG